MISTLPWLILSRQRPQILMALRNTITALAALLVAFSLHLECPYWAAMTALIVIQPTRGLLLEKSLYRLLGTVIGSIAGLLLLQHTGSPLLLTAALALWIAFCVGLGNLLYGLRAYACMLAGYTCSVVALIAYDNPPHLYDIAFGRIACIIVGIIVATAVTALVTPNQSRTELDQRLRRVSGQTIAWLALLLREGRCDSLVQRERQILVEIAEIESLLEIVGAGSLSFRSQKRHIRNLLATLLSQLAIGRLAAESLGRHRDLDGQHSYWRGLLARKLDTVDEMLVGALPVACLDEIASIAAHAKVHLPLLGETLEEVATSLQWVLGDYSSPTALREERPANGLIRHLDWLETGRSVLRAVLAITVVGSIWGATGWPQGPMLLIPVCIMTSLFSNKEHPAAFLQQIFVGVIVGTGAGVFCRLVLLPGVTEPMVGIVILAPFLLCGVFAMTQKRTAVPAMDGTLFFIFITQPGVVASAAPRQLVLGATAMAMGVGVAWFAYRFLVPISPAIRMRSLLRAITQDIEDLARPLAEREREKLQARLDHRVIRLATLAKHTDTEQLHLVDVGLAALAIGVCIKRLQHVQRQGRLSPEVDRLTREALATLADLTRSPQHILPALGADVTAFPGILGQEWDGKDTADHRAADALRDAASIFGGNGWLLDPGGDCCC